eukprot:GHRR01010823.1.p1 GENE.GHRR01010823.1~~GHRR01010823.1.p1  ORF type:complete len:236 (+),score=62.90 GHRR01010823.1:125-832(+)
MDLAVVLPLACLFVIQTLLSLLLLCPRAISRHIAALMSLTRTNAAVTAVIYTVAVAVLTITASSVIQLVGVLSSLKAPQMGEGVLALTVEELRALLGVVLGAANLALLFLSRSLAHEQRVADKAALNLSVLQKQAKGLETEYLRATTKEETASTDRGSSNSEVSKLIAEKQRLQEALQEAQTASQAAEKTTVAIKAQSKGLEREYDRLLSESDGLKRRLARFDPHFLGGGDKKSE